MIQIIVEKDWATVQGPLPIYFLTVLSTLAGRKPEWKNGTVRFEASPGNLRLIKESDAKVEWIDKTGEIAALEEMERLATQHAHLPHAITPYKPKRQLREKSQQACIDICWQRENYAWFHECGLGKTVVGTANAGMLYATKRITGLLIIAPNGVHEQWLEEQFPINWDDQYHYTGFIWNGKRLKSWNFQPNGLAVLAMNTDSLRTEAGLETIKEFLRIHRYKNMCIVDESHLFADTRSTRTENLISIRELCTFRRISTGTPQGKDVTNLWAQYMFLDPRILGYDYFTAFKSRYCIVGGYGGKEVLAQKNSEELYQKRAPHEFRITKKESGLELPEKQYVLRRYHMGAKTKKHYDDMKHTWMTAFDNGEICDVPNACVALLRLQQIVCGYLPKADGTIEPIGEQERIHETLEIARQVEGQIVIWARFTQDINALVKALGDEAVPYYGEISNTENAENKKLFVSGKRRIFIGNQAKGGTGTDGLQCAQTEIFHSNSFKAIDRWQGEDRCHRDGMGESLTIFDVLAAGTVDTQILANLRKKKSMADLNLDTIRQMIAEPEPVLSAEDLELLTA